MLTLFLNVFPAPLMGVGRPFGCCSVFVGTGVGGFRLIDGALRLLRGVLGAVKEPEGRGMLGRGLGNGECGEVSALPVLLRDLGTGKAGRAMLGGPFDVDGRDGRGNVVAIAAADIYINMCDGFEIGFWCSFSAYRGFFYCD